jgi:hypothetical protein
LATPVLPAQYREKSAMHEIRPARIVSATLAGICMLVAIGLIATPAAAQRQTSPYCANFGDQGGRDCSYPSFQACLAAISGAGGQCEVNSFGPSNPPRRGLFDQIFRPDAATAAFQAAQPRQIVPSKYCAVYNDGTRNCGFPTVQACRQAVSGVGGACRRNPRAPG